MKGSQQRKASSNIMGLFLHETIAIWKSHLVARYVRLLAPLTPLTHFAVLCSLAPFTGSLTHFSHSLVGRWNSSICYLWTQSTGKKHVCCRQEKHAQRRRNSGRVSSKDEKRVCSRETRSQREHIFKNFIVPRGSERSEWASPWTERASEVKRSAAKLVSGVSKRM